MVGKEDVGPCSNVEQSSKTTVGKFYSCCLYGIRHLICSGVMFLPSPAQGWLHFLVSMEDMISENDVCREQVLT